MSPRNTQSEARCDYKPNVDQQKVIENTEGPLLVIAGPGTGKTATMVARIENLVINKGVRPGEIMVATFSEKAAKELVTRISNAFAKTGRQLNIDQMVIGTFHSICLRILREYAPETGLKNISISNEFDVLYQIKRNRAFDTKLFESGLFKRPWGGLSKGYWLAKDFVSLLDTVKEERVTTERLRNSGDAELMKAADLLDAYDSEMKTAGVLSYADLQVKVLDLFDEHPEVLADLQQRIRYIIVDEYQDTNHIQEQIVLKLAGAGANICVVGDDDQSLYRFRGATVQNILEFEKNFAPSRCKLAQLKTNYRSQRGIIDFCKQWMGSTRYGIDGTAGFDWEVNGTPLRRKKTLKTGRTDAEQDAACAPVVVVSCTGAGVDDWHEKIYQLIENIKQADGFTDLNQIAFICNSVRNDSIRSLIRSLEEKGIPVYSPRSGGYRLRCEVRQAVGCIILCFKDAKYCAEGKNQLRVSDYADEIEAAEKLCAAYPSLRAWIKKKQAYFKNQNNAFAAKDEHSMLNLFYEMMQFEPFKGVLDSADASSLASSMPARNLAQLASLLEGFEASLNAGSKNGWSNPSYVAREFFNRFFHDMDESDSLWEYEDDEEYAPSGYVSFLTVHQAKGMEFPVVVVCSLGEKVFESSETLNDKVRALGGARAVIEPYEYVSYLDYWRKYYTAFSRAQDLLVLTHSGENADSLQPQFRKLYEGLPDVATLDLGSVRLCEVKPTNLLHTYAFTSDMAAYASCPRRYKFHKMLGFPAVTGQAELFGQLVHQSVEDIHRIVQRRGVSYIPKDEVQAIIGENCASLELAEHAQLRAKTGQAFRQVMNYLINSKDLWQRLLHAELNVSDVRVLEHGKHGGYILKGQIDLVTNNDGATTIVDFKTGRQPKAGSKTLAHYEQQLMLYVHLLGQRDDVDASSITKAMLYFTGVNDNGKSSGNERPILSFDVKRGDVGAVVKEFDGIVTKIENNDFDETAQDESDCKHCAFRWYCGKE